MAKSLQLADGTVLDLKVDPMRRWKKFKGYELFITALVSLFPMLAHPLDETMYSFLSDESIPHFLTVCLAVSMIHERYRCLPDYAMDFYYALKEQKTFSVCVNNEGLYCYPEGLSQYSVKQVTVSGEAVSKLMSLLSSVEVLDEAAEAKVVTQEYSGTLYDSSPSVVQPRTSTTRYSLTHSECTPGNCNLCDYLRAIPYHKYGPLHKLVPAPGCKSYSYDPQPLESVLSLTRAYGNENIIVYGSSFSTRIPHRIPDQLHELEVNRVRLRVKQLPRFDSGIAIEDYCSGSLHEKRKSGLTLDKPQKHFKT
jgi:hypothetical protein